MRRISFLRTLLLMLFLAGARIAAAQTLTTVTGTIVDPNGVPYAAGTVKVVIVPPSGGASPTVTATAGPVIVPLPSTTNSSGFFSMVLVANGSITPASTTYTFTFCAPVVPPPLGSGNSCFTITGVTIAGSSQDISTTANAAAPVLLTPVNPLRVGTNDQTLLGANVAATTVFTLPSQGVQRYRVSCYAIVTRAATTSSTLPSCSVTFTDADNATAQTVQIAASNAGNTLTTLTQGTVIISAGLGTVVQVSTAAFASSGATSMQYALHFKVEQLGN